jgi:pre-rRNA-processing protein IPI3
MLAEEFFSSISGPPLSSNTAIAKDVGIYTHSLWPTFAAKSAFKKSSTPPNCLAANKTHVFAAQHEKAYVHVYSRLRGNQEAFVALPERIRCLTLAGDVLILGTVEGRIMLWEVGSLRYSIYTTALIHFADIICRHVQVDWCLCLPVTSRPCPAW